MIYQQQQPHPALTPYIDAFWITAGDSKAQERVKIMPDGCIDIIINLGEDCKTDNGATTVSHGKTYLVGTMSRYKIADIHPGTRMLGIRFKPAAFSAFYPSVPLHEVANITVEIPGSFLPDPGKIITDPGTHLSRFFLDKFVPPRHNLLQVIADVKKHKGLISVTDLTKRHFITTRQLERAFRQHVGISPKEFINFIRYQFVLPAIRNKPSEKSLADIAFDYGYYDHAHLANEVKRYTGTVPSQL